MSMHEYKSLRERLTFTQRHLWFLVPAGCAFMVASALTPWSPFAFDLVMAGTFLLGLGFSFWGLDIDDVALERVHVDALTPLRSKRSALAIGLILFLFVSAVLGGLGFLAWSFVADWPPGHVDPNDPATRLVNHIWPAAAVAIYAALVFPTFWLGCYQPVRELLKPILDASRLGPHSRAGERVRLAGVVVDPTPIAVGNAPAALSLFRDEEVVPGSSPNIVVRTPGADRTFYVQGEGVAVEIAPDGLVFTGGLHLKWTAHDARGAEHNLSHNFIPVGSHVLVSGELAPIVRGGAFRLVPGRDAPVCLIRHEPDEDPEAILRSARRRARVAGLVLLAWAVAAIVAAVSLTAL